MAVDGAPARMFEQALARALERARLPESERPTVAYFLRRQDDSWRDCCGSGCEPCVQAIAVAVDTARALLAGGGTGAGRACTPDGRAPTRRQPA